jgi:CDP-diacylglycerol--serine O-phosphatidyltransferase
MGKQTDHTTATGSASAAADATSTGEVLTDAESGDELTINAPLSRRRSSLFSLDNTPLDPPDETDFKKFTSDEYHFSLIRNLHLADFITLLNGFSGFYSIISCLRFTLTSQPHYVQRAHFFILLGLFFDFFDGRVARIRNKSSLMGQELDSLADLISFGVAPASIAFAIGFQTTIDVLILSFFVLSGLTRLARFNVTVTAIPKDMKGKSKYFEGLPIPTSLGLVALMAYLVHKDYVNGNLPLGVLWKGSFLEFHPIVLIFFLHGSALISKSLKIPKP